MIRKSIQGHFHAAAASSYHEIQSNINGGLWLVGTPSNETPTHPRQVVERCLATWHQDSRLPPISTTRRTCTWISIIIPCQRLPPISIVAEGFKVPGRGY